MTPAASEIIAFEGVRYQQTKDAAWRVTVDGTETFDITQEGGSFISWAAGRSTHWCFSKALNDGVETARYQREQHRAAVAEREAYEFSLRGMSASQRAARIAALEDQREALRYGAASHYDVVARSGEISRQIADVRGIA
jgi:hypothetical protein